MQNISNPCVQVNLADDNDALSIQTHSGAAFHLSVWKNLRWHPDGLLPYYEHPEKRAFTWNSDVTLIECLPLPSGNGWSWLVGLADVQVQLTIQLNDGPHLYYSLQALTDSDASPNISWPGSLAFADQQQFSKEELYFPYCQGFVMEAKLDAEILPMIADTNCGPGQSLPFMGVRNQRGSGWMIHALTTDDCAFEIASPSGKGIEARQIWRPSLGRMRYPRQGIISVFDQADGTTFAKTYKQRIQNGPLWKTLEEKTDNNPRLTKLKGAPYCFLAHYPYEDRAEDILAAWKFIREVGYPNALMGPGPSGTKIQLDGEEGSIQAEARQAILEIEKEGALVFNWLLPNLMDRRRQGYSDSNARKEKDGSVIPGWETGHQKLNPICSLLQEQSPHMNWTSIEEVAGHHFDTTAMEALHECWSDEHPCSRTVDRISRERLVGRLTALGHFAVSEAGCEWAVPHFHMLSLNNFGHHITNSKTGWEPTPFPLFSLAFRECVLSCWHETDTWHDSRPEDKRLYDASIGAVPTLNPCGKMFLLYDGKPDANKSEFHTRRSNDPEVQAIITSGIDIAALAAQTWGLELESFVYLDDARMVSKSTFAGGSTILVNRSHASYNENNNIVEARQFKVQ